VIICGYELLGEVEAGRANYTTVEHIVSIGGDPEELECRNLLGYERLLASASDQIESVRVSPYSLAATFFTSGTTGLPKGCMHLISTIIGSVHSFPLTFGGLRPTDVFLGSPPLAFVIGYGYNMLLPLLGGVPSVILEGRMSVESLVEAIPRYKVTMFNAVPTAFNQLLKLPNIRDYDLSSLRVVMSGSAPLFASTFQEFKDLTGLEIVNGIGSSESIGTQLASYLPGYKPGATGWPVPGVQAKIIDEEDKECAPGVTGRLAIKACYGTMYWRNPERQMEAVVDGWSLSGDYAYKDEDGLYWHVSRIDDIIKSRGYRVSPGEVEDALNEHPAIYESTVIGVPDAEQGQKVKAFVVLRPGFTGSPELTEEIRAGVKKKVAPYMAPSEMEFVDSLPKTETGKVRRVELRELEARRLLKNDVSPPGCDAAQDEDAKSINSSHISATKDNVLRRPAHSGGRDFVPQQPDERAAEREAAAGSAASGAAAAPTAGAAGVAGAVASGAAAAPTAGAAEAAGAPSVAAAEAAAEGHAGGGNAPGSPGGEA
jgi:2-aminobenzoate-CoA ligase